MRSRPAPDTKQETSPSERWLSVPEIAAYLGVSTDFVYTWVAKGLPAYKVGRCWKFQRAEVDTWVRSGQAAD